MFVSSNPRMATPRRTSRAAMRSSGRTGARTGEDAASFGESSTIAAVLEPDAPAVSAPSAPLPSGSSRRTANYAFLSRSFAVSVAQYLLRLRLHARRRLFREDG